MIQQILGYFKRFSGLRAAALGFLGIATLFFPEFLKSGMVYAIAGYALLNVVLLLVHSLADSAQSGKRYRPGYLAGAALLGGFGALCIVYSRHLVSMLPIFLGVVMFVLGVGYFLAAATAGFPWRPLLMIISGLALGGGFVTIIYAFGFGGLQGLSVIVGFPFLLLCAYELLVFLYRNKGEPGAGTLQMIAKRH